MKQVGSDRQNTLDARAHQGRGDHESAAGADAAGDQAGADADQDGSNKNSG